MECNFNSIDSEIIWNASIHVREQQQSGDVSRKSYHEPSSGVSAFDRFTSSEVRHLIAAFIIFTFATVDRRSERRKLKIEMYSAPTQVFGYNKIPTKTELNREQN